MQLFSLTWCLCKISLTSAPGMQDIKIKWQRLEDQGPRKGGGIEPSFDVSLATLGYTSTLSSRIFHEMQAAVRWYPQRAKVMAWHLTDAVLLPWWVALQTESDAWLSATGRICTATGRLTEAAAWTNSADSCREASPSWNQAVPTAWRCPGFQPQPQSAQV